MTIRVDVQYAWRGEAMPSVRELRRWVRAALEDLREDAEVSIRIVNEEESARLNQIFRGCAEPTNVLSFPFEPPGDAAMPFLGDLAICGPVVIREAAEQGKTARAHWAHMLIHGTLHLLGYDHQREDEAERMEPLEVRVLARLGFPDPYAV